MIPSSAPARLLLFSFLLLPAAAQKTTPAKKPGSLVLIENRTALIREETVRVSVPFAEGRVKGIPGLVVEGKPTAWLILERWPGGSTRVAQAQFPLRLAPRKRVNLPLVEGKPLAGPFKPHPWFRKRPAGPLLEAESAFKEDPPRRVSLRTGGRTLGETPLVRTSRRTLDLGEGWTLRTYLTEFSSTPVLQADLVLSAGKGRKKPPAFRHLDLVERDLPVMILHPRLSGAGAPLRDKEGRLHLPLVVDSAPEGDKVFRWRIFLLLDSAEAPTLQRGIAKRTWQAMALRPLDPLCDAPAWLASGALTLFGGPAPPPPDWRRRILRETAFRAGKMPFYSIPLPPLPLDEAAAARVPPCDPFWLHAVQTSRGGLLEYLAPGFDAWTGLGAWWARDLFLERVEAARKRVQVEERSLAPAAEGLLARSLVEAAMARQETRDDKARNFLAGRIRELLLPRLEKDPSWVTSPRAGPFLLGMWAAWRHLRIREAREACRLVLRALPEKTTPPTDAALPLHILSHEPFLPESLKKKARSLSLSILSDLEDPLRLWDPPAALVPILLPPSGK